MIKLIISILRVLIQPFRKIKYCHSSCCESECIRETNNNNNVCE